MPRIARYSSSRHAGAEAQGVREPFLSEQSPLRAPDPAPDGSGPPSPPPTPPAAPGHSRGLLVTAVLLLALNLGVMTYWVVEIRQPPAQQITQKDIDAAVLHTLKTQTLPSPTARAAAKIAPSIVHVTGYVRTRRGTEIERGEGTGVVVVDKGVVLTNLHVVRGSRRIELEFADGSTTNAKLINARPENDLAVLQAEEVPDDLVAATLRTTGGLNVGDAVIAVGYPFGIGPSVSAGIVSGLDREFQSPEGKQVLRNLIQFDAAANPGNSGGPLVNMEGEVVGIVTAILNPTSARTSLGIGFAVPIENATKAIGTPPF